MAKTSPSACSGVRIGYLMRGIRPPDTRKVGCLSTEMWRSEAPSFKITVINSSNSFLCSMALLFLSIRPSCNHGVYLLHHFGGGKIRFNDVIRRSQAHSLFNILFLPEIS